MFKALLASLIVFSFSATHSKDTAAQKTAPAFSFYKESDFSKLKEFKPCYEWSAIRADKN